MTASSRSAAGQRVVVVGAGVGGLATAVRLLAAGHRVTVLERAPAPGGKMRQIAVGDRLFDGGPSVMTMPFVLDDLCAAGGVRREDLVRLLPLDPICRHFFPDGTVLAVGGRSTGNTFPVGAERYDPLTNTWSAAGNISAGREWIRATLLGNGKVLATGGQNAAASFANADLYDPATNSWAPTTPMPKSC